MLIYLDTKDLIELTERKSESEYQQIHNNLHANNHQLALSLSLILELCAPLSQAEKSSVITRTLNRVEDLPHCHIAETKIQRDELVSAVQAYALGIEYQRIDPYVARFDEGRAFPATSHKAVLKVRSCSSSIRVLEHMPRSF